MSLTARGHASAALLSNGICQLYLLTHFQPSSEDKKHLMFKEIWSHPSKAGCVWMALTHTRYEDASQACQALPVCSQLHMHHTPTERCLCVERNATVRVCECGAQKRSHVPKTGHKIQEMRKTSWIYKRHQSQQSQSWHVLLSGSPAARRQRRWSWTVLLLSHWCPGQFRTLGKCVLG